MAIEVKSWLVPQYLEEGLIDSVLAADRLARPTHGLARRNETCPDVRREIHDTAVRWPKEARWPQ
jgi:hypothetical protein